MVVVLGRILRKTLGLPHDFGKTLAEGMAGFGQRAGLSFYLKPDNGAPRQLDRLIQHNDAVFNVSLVNATDKSRETAILVRVSPCGSTPGSARTTLLSVASL